jgi:hypothetical protein
LPRRVKFSRLPRKLPSNPKEFLKRKFLGTDFIRAQKFGEIYVENILRKGR